MWAERKNDLSRSFFSGLILYRIEHEPADLQSLLQLLAAVNWKDIKETWDSIFSLSKKLSKKINKAEKVYQKLVSIRYEVKPSSSRYIPVRVRKAVLIRDNYRCVKCGSQKNLQFDHIVAVANGGSNEEANVQVLCSVCNLEKGVS